MAEIILIKEYLKFFVLRTTFPYVDYHYYNFYITLYSEFYNLLNNIIFVKLIRTYSWSFYLFLRERKPTWTIQAGYEDVFREESYLHDGLWFARYAEGQVQRQHRFMSSNASSQRLTFPTISNECELCLGKWNSQVWWERRSSREVKFAFR